MWLLYEVWISSLSSNSNNFLSKARIGVSEITYSRGENLLGESFCFGTPKPVRKEVESHSGAAIPLCPW